MIIQLAGIYAILNDYPPLNTFKEWRYLIAGTLYDDALVLPQTVSPKPSYNLKTQKLVETITVCVYDVLQNWEIQNLSVQETEDRKRPDGEGFQKEMIANPDLLKIYQKILTNYAVSGMWLNEVRASLAVYIRPAFAVAINQLASSGNFTKEEIATVNAILYKYDLELITWLP